MVKKVAPMIMGKEIFFINESILSHSYKVVTTLENKGKCKRVTRGLQGMLSGYTH